MTTHWGPLTPDRHHVLRLSGVHLRVFARGVDVTDRCSYADDTPGREAAVLGSVVGDFEVVHGGVKICAFVLV